MPVVAFARVRESSKSARSVASSELAQHGRARAPVQPCMSYPNDDAAP